MKRTKFLKIFLLLTILVTVFSCKEDDKNENQASDLIGEWQRSDFSDEFEYKLTFYAEHTGIKTEREGDINGQGISSAVMFNWTTNGDILSLDFDGEITTTPFFINPNGQLYLSDLTEFYFIKFD